MRTLRIPALVLLVFALAGCTVPVAAGLDESEANAVVVALDQAGIEAAKEADPEAEGKFRVEVLRENAPRALVTMAEDNLPRPRARGVLESDGAALVPSQAAEHARLLVGLAGELERTLTAVDGVLRARVHLNVPARDPFLSRDATGPKATASVLLEHRGTTPPLGPESIQRLVAGGAEGLDPASVAVVFVARPGRATARNGELAHVGPIAVARGSMTTLKLALGGLVGVVLLLSAITLALYAQVVRLRREREVPSPRSTSPALRVPGPGS